MKSNWAQRFLTNVWRQKLVTGDTQVLLEHSPALYCKYQKRYFLLKNINFAPASVSKWVSMQNHSRLMKMHSLYRFFFMKIKLILLWKVFHNDFSNDPDKNCSIFYCSAAIRSPHVETVLFSDEEFFNRWKASLRNKMYLYTILKGSFLCVKTFQPKLFTTVVNKDNRSFQFSNVPHKGLLLYST